MKIWCGYIWARQYLSLLTSQFLSHAGFWVSLGSKDNWVRDDIAQQQKTKHWKYSAASVVSSFLVCS